MPRSYQEIVDSIYHLLRGATGPTSTSGMTNWLKAMDDHCVNFPAVKSVIAEGIPMMHHFSDGFTQSPRQSTIQPCLPCRGPWGWLPLAPTIPPRIICF